MRYHCHVVPYVEFVVVCRYIEADFAISLVCPTHCCISPIYPRQSAYLLHASTVTPPALLTRSIKYQPLYDTMQCNEWCKYCTSMASPTALVLRRCEAMSRAHVLPLCVVGLQFGYAQRKVIRNVILGLHTKLP